MPSSRRSVLAAGATGALTLTAGCFEFVTGDGPLEFEAARIGPTEAALEETGYELADVEEERFEETVEFGVEREIHASFWYATYTKSPTPDDEGAEELLEGDEPAPEETGEEDEADDEALLDEHGDELPSDETEADTTDDDGAALGELDGASMDDAMPFDSGDLGEHTFVAVSTPGIEVAGRSLNPLEGLAADELLEELLDQSDQDVEDVSHEESVTLEILGEDRDVDRFTGHAGPNGESPPISFTVTSFGHADDFIVLLGAHPEAFEAETEHVETLMTSVEHPLEES
ncbi:DUF6517 family protein [Natrarchaeobaculum sulfurireducens]|uniref:Uncharacterized protein n=1 Tax=Natrarchaeobaculum sulfurireducens TaxID=2044521 RepID=A0A346PEL4_9EURY|nr:DUF6517 family protein [Natrarchaeobaculum sulfurireducens]AXR77959.1 hypothetical protein AArc1_1628 [Natrarchaeobaculum sulfurireducens]